MMKRNVLVLLLCLVSGCGSTHIQYSEWHPNDPVESTALKFQLHESAITLQIPNANTAKDASKGPSLTAMSPSCTDDSDSWWKCFNNVTANAIIAPPDLNSDSGPKPKIYIAQPDDPPFNTTSIQGSPISGQDFIYSSITIKYTDNTATVLSGAASGAAAGFGIAGPYGAVAGFVIGGASATFTTKKGVAQVKAPPPPTLTLEDFICDGEPVDFSDLGAKALQKTQLYLPITINSKHFKPLLDINHNKLVTKHDNPDACWHVLPNTGHLGDAQPLIIKELPEKDGKTTKRKPLDGDGWLYRLVSVDSINEKKSGGDGSIEAAEFFKDGSAHPHEFPYSACRNVVLQVTWWKELSDALADDKHRDNFKVLTYQTVIADSAYVNVATLQKGGVITFKPGCGATVSMTNDNSTAAIINAMVSASQTIYNAEKTWAKSQSSSQTPVQTPGQAPNPKKNNN